MVQSYLHYISWQNMTKKVKFHVTNAKRSISKVTGSTVTKRNSGSTSSLNFPPPFMENPNNRVPRSSTSPSGLPISKFLSVKFPLSVAESFDHYLDRNNLDSCQNQLLKLLRAEKLHNVKTEVLKVPIDIDEEGKVLSSPSEYADCANYINEVCISSKNSSYSEAKHLVLVHGYGAGIGFFIKNLESIAGYLNENPYEKWYVHAIDLLGYGLSSRPKINYKTNGSLENFEQWFANSIESWRLQRGLTNRSNVLAVAHSLGAYLFLRYNTLFPNTIKKLVLVSPAGIMKPQPHAHKKSPKWFEFLWNLNVSPFSLVRYSGPLGSLFVSGWTSRRFSHLSNLEQKLLHNYAYGIFNARGSGEYFLNYVLSAGGVPRHPFVENHSRMSLVNCDTEWLYGENDWMNSEGGRRATQFLRERNLQSETKIFKNCGHHIYLDDILGFNEYLIDQLRSFGNQ